MRTEYRLTGSQIIDSVTTIKTIDPLEAELKRLYAAVDAASAAADRLSAALKSKKEREAAL